MLSDRRQYSGLFDRVDQVARPGPLRPDDVADHEEGCRGHLRLEKAVDQLGLAVRGAGGVRQPAAQGVLLVQQGHDLEELVAQRGCVGGRQDVVEAPDHLSQRGTADTLHQRTSAC